MRLILSGLFISGFAGSILSANATDIRELSRECEIALAQSAAPRHLWEGAGVFVLGSTAYERVKDSENGFECLLERNHPDSAIPICFDAQSTDANLALTLEKGKLIRQGKSFEEVSAKVERKLSEGDYPIAGYGVVYMVSDYNYIFNSERNVMLKVAPHVMFHAPNIKNSDIGSNPRAAFANRGLPMINAEGPHGFMVSFVEHSSDSSRVETECNGQLPPRANMTAFPPSSQ